ncbi:MAG TPA: outer membrane beta-barrel protein [Chthoniobacterales bacterium]|nr:outer membrane beta-barrel protein [Chthoniobacterales bacterium]
MIKQAFLRTVITFALTGVTAGAFAGTASLRDSKDVKQVVQEPTPAAMCDWTGPYVGVHAGGQFGDSVTHDFATGRVFGYDQSGFNGGLQVGYNFQWNWLVLGPEIDVGYMNVEGEGVEPRFPNVRGETDSDFYTTMRGRIGVRLNCGGCWLLYATGGAIGMNYTTRYHVDPNFFDARGNDFNWGYTVGGGVERKIGRHWSVKAEYLYFSTDEQSFGEPIAGVPVDFRAESRGHIIRGGLNYQF